jgi:hypothetical protein
MRAPKFSGITENVSTPLPGGLRIAALSELAS